MAMPLIADLILTMTLITTLYRSRSGLARCVIEAALLDPGPLSSPYHVYICSGSFIDGIITYVVNTGAPQLVLATIATSGMLTYGVYQDCFIGTYSEHSCRRG